MNDILAINHSLQCEYLTMLTDTKHTLTEDGTILPIIFMFKKILHSLGLEPQYNMEKYQCHYMLFINSD